MSFPRILSLALTFAGSVCAAETTSAVPPSRSAQPSGDLAVQVWSLEHGLPNSTVTAVTQTADGYLWVGTFNGLARFDGVRFVTFNPVNTPAMKHARIQRLHVDPAGTLWVNTYDGALISFRDGVFSEEWGSEIATARAAKISPVATHGRDLIFAIETGELIRRPLEAKGPGNWRSLRPPVGLAENALYCEDGAGVLWCLTRDKRIWKVDGDSFVPVTTAETFGSDHPMRLIADRAGKLWVRTVRGIFRWDGTRFESMMPVGEDTPSEMRLLFFPREGGCWTIADERFRKVEGRRWTQEVAEWRNVLGTEYPIFQQMHEDRHGGLWFAPPHLGVFYLAPNGRATRLTTKDGLPVDFISAWFEDREGNIWLGAERGGLIRLRKKRFQALHLGGDLPSAPAMSVSEDRDGAIWVGTFGNGLVRARDGRTDHFLASKEGPGRYVLSVFPDATGGIWASAGREDLHRVADGSLELAGWTAHGIKALFVDRGDRLWIGTKNELFCGANGKLQTFEAFSGVNRHEVRSITEDRAGNIWVGLGSGVLYRYDGREFVAFKPDDISVLYPIWSLCPDDDGTLWVGTFGGGLLRMKDGKFFRITKKMGLPDDVVCQILDDGAGNLWIGSHQGVFRVGKDALRAFSDGKIAAVPSLVFGRHDGLPSLECTGGYQPSAWRGRDGTLWFATAGGVASVQPSKLAANPSSPSVTIESVVVDGGRAQAVRAHAAGGWADDGVGGARDGETKKAAFSVPAGGKHLEFQYTGLCFASPDQVRFRYRLEGLEKEWVEAGPRRSAQYSYLRPGLYRFLVSACNSDGVWNETGASLAIEVAPHFWETWWFIGLFFAVGIGTITIGVHGISTRKLRRKLQGLERQRAIEEDRARIARDIHDDLGAGLTQITLASELLRRAPDGAEEHVRHISETAHALTRAMDEIVWAVNPKNDSLENLVSYICSFTQEYLRNAKVKCRLEMPAQLPVTPVSSEIRHHLFVSIKETLNNILKHAAASEVWLRLKLDGATITFAIEDNGRGMAAETSRETNPARLRSGQGLSNLKTRMAAVGGECVLSAGPHGQGSRIALTVPYASAPVRERRNL